MPSPHLRAYPQVTVIAEKVHAMVVLGLSNSRMKDDFDVWMLQRGFAIDAVRLQRAIEATFARRRTAVPPMMPEGLSDAFDNDPTKRAQWHPFVRKLSAPGPTLPKVVMGLRAWLVNVFKARSNRRPSRTGDLISLALEAAVNPLQEAECRKDIGDRPADPARPGKTNGSAPCES